MQGTGKSVQGDPRGLGWHIAYDGTLYHVSRSSGWYFIGTGYKEVAYASNSANGQQFVYLVDNNGAMKRAVTTNYVKYSFATIQGIAKIVDVGWDGTACHIGNDGYIYILLNGNGGWVTIGSNGQDIGVDDANGIYMVDMSNNLYRYGGSVGQWTRITLGFSAKSVDVDQDYVYLLSTSGSVHKLNRATNAVTQLSGLTASTIGCSSYR
jgi:hypothetical protein